jgi:hypothetical protein
MVFKRRNNHEAMKRVHMHPNASHRIHVAADVRRLTSSLNQRRRRRKETHLWSSSAETIPKPRSVPHVVASASSRSL